MREWPEVPPRAFSPWCEIYLAPAQRLGIYLVVSDAPENVLQEVILPGLAEDHPVGGQGFPERRQAQARVADTLRTRPFLEPGWRRSGVKEPPGQERTSVHPASPVSQLAQTRRDLTCTPSVPSPS